MNVEIIMPLHDIDTPKKWAFFEETCYCLSRSGVPVHIYADNTVQVRDQNNPFDLIKKYGFILTENAPDTEWGKVTWAYAQSKEKYVAICHADDFWIERKMEYQMKYIHDAAMVLSSYIVHEPFHIKNEIQKGCVRIDTPQIHSKYGIYFAMPSMWLLNKTKIPEMVIPFKAATAIDLAVALTNCQYGTVFVVRKPLLIWNDHLENGTHKFSVSNTVDCEDALQKLEGYAKTLPQPNLKYVWE